MPRHEIRAPVTPALTHAGAGPPAAAVRRGIFDPASPGPLIMGILNVTPDSFSDGGKFSTPNAALAAARRMHQAGAHIIDVGGESTRPGAAPVSIDQELARVLPVIERIRDELEVAVSIDTSKPEVMRAAATSGACMINDVRALRAPGALETARDLKLPVCLMHMLGKPRTMQANPRYDDVVTEVRDFLVSRAATCMNAGISRDRIVIDPGFGFGKNLSHNLALLGRLETLVETGYPVLVGLSRKSMLGTMLNKSVDERMHGSIALALMAYLRGARIFRVHDVEATADALRVAERVLAATDPCTSRSWR